MKENILKNNIIDNLKNLKNKETNYPPIKKLKEARNKKIKKYSINALKTNDKTSSNLIKGIEINNIPLNGKINKNIKTNLMTNEERIKMILRYNEYELNTLEYKEALKVDKRIYFQYYFSLLKTKDLLLFSFYPLKNDYNSKIIKFYLFFYTFTINYTVNGFFFNESTIHQIKEDGGKFNFGYQIRQIIYSSFISSCLDMVVRFLSLSERNILEIKHEKQITNLDKKIKIILKRLSYKFILFFIISFILLLFFWYYISCFGSVYKNTQVYLIKDSLISFGFSLLYPVGLYLIPGLFRIPSLKDPKRENLYKFSKIIQLL